MFEEKEKEDATQEESVEATHDPYLYTDGLEGLFQLPEEISESVKIPKHDIKPLPETRTGRKIKKPSYLEYFINK